MSIFASTALGSPPRMRGKPRKAAGFRRRKGITPAHAGKTYHARCTISGSRDHPRACGENSAGWCCSMRTAGSPPRMRGKPPPTTGRGYGGGITPAHAGKTECPHQSRRGARDHPRACGENFLATSRCVRRAGSPPRMRGKPGRLCRTG